MLGISAQPAPGLTRSPALPFTPPLSRGMSPVPRPVPPEPRETDEAPDQVHFRHGGRALVAGQGAVLRVDRSAARGARPAGRLPEARPVPERGPGYDEP